MDSIKFFCIVGAQRSGSTFLKSVLSNHKKVRFTSPAKPEPKYFLNDDFECFNREQYLNKYFNEEKRNGELGDLILGEKSTSYIEFEYVPRRVKSFFPEAKAIVILRNPVERALSNYYFTKEHGLEVRSLEDVFLLNVPSPIGDFKTSVSPFEYVKRGEYINYLKPFKNGFGENLLVVLLEELVNIQSSNEKLFNFLGLDAPSIKRKSINYNSSNKSAIVDDEKVMNRIKEKLYSHYAPFNNELEFYLDKDLSHWKKL